MTEKYLKARIPAALYQELQVRAAEGGKRLGTHVRDVLQAHSEAMSVGAALERIEAAIAERGAPPVTTADAGMRPLMQEVRLLVRELAMNANAQIVARVAAQMSVQSTQEGAR
jgi:hypothetical protein